MVWVCFTLPVTPVDSEPVDALPLADLWRVVSALVAQVATLQDAGDQHMAVLALKDAEIAALKDEIARLKGLPPRPKFKVKPLGMEQRPQSLWARGDAGAAVAPCATDCR